MAKGVRIGTQDNFCCKGPKSGDVTSEPVMSDLLPLGYMHPEMAMNLAQHNILNSIQT